LTPFVTEEIWTAVAPLAGRNGPTIMLEPYPESQDFARDEAAERALAPIKAAIEGPRQIRAQLNVPPSRNIALYFTGSETDDERALRANQSLVTAVGNLSELHFVAAGASLPPSATAIVNGRTMRSPLANLIDDVNEEIARLQKRRGKTAQELKKSETKLANENFVRNAPAPVVEQERQRIADFTRELAQLDVQLKQLEELK
jgi:valyl-tRNA synthetase